MNIHPQNRQVFVAIDLVCLVVLLLLESSNDGSASNTFLEETGSFFMLFIQGVYDVVRWLSDQLVELIESPEEKEDEEQVHGSLSDNHPQGNQK